MRNNLTKIAALALFFLLLSGIADRAAACTQPPEPPPPIWIIQDASHAKNEAWIIIHDYETFLANTSQFCTCALTKVSAIKSVNLAVIVEGGTDIPIGAFSFVENPVSSAAWTSINGGVEMAGFQSGIAVPLPGGTNVDLHFDVTLNNGATLNDLRDQLAAAGAAVGTDESDPAGQPTGGHLELRAAGSTGIMAVQHFPTLTEWAMIVISAAMLLGIVYVRRVHTRRATSLA
jgi:hypothetical protein